MCRLNWMLPVLLLFSCGFTIAQDLGKVFMNGLKSNNSKVFYEHFSSSVNLSINRQERVYSKSQAQLVLADFFRNNKSIEVINLSSSVNKPNDRYFVFSFKTSQKVYRVVLKLIDIKGKSVISEFRID